MNEPELVELARAFGKVYLLLADSYTPVDNLSLTVNQRLALGAIADFAPLPLYGLAALIATSAPTASRVVDGLVDVGYVKREPDPDDRRAVRLMLTRRGRARVDRQRARVGARLAPAVAHLAPEERRALLALVSEVAAGLRPPRRANEVIRSPAEVGA